MIATIRSLTLFLLVCLICGCGVAVSYRPSDQKTIRDYANETPYRKRVGVMALANSTVFISDQVTVPLMDTFLATLADTTPDAILVVPGKTDAPPFLWNPPLNTTGDVDTFTLSAQARLEGLNLVVRPVLMDVRVRKRDTGFWFFKDVAYSLQVQTAATSYDTITGARLALEILVEELDIDEDQAQMIQNRQEVAGDEVIARIVEMAETLGERMGEAIEESAWQSSVIAVEDSTVIIPAGSAVGIQTGDRLSVLSVGGPLTGMDGQRYLVPGTKIGEITIDRTTTDQSSATAQSDTIFPVGSIVVPGS